jgi:hypothetical protein
MSLFEEFTDDDLRNLCRAIIRKLPDETARQLIEDVLRDREEDQRKKKK